MPKLPLIGTGAAQLLQWILIPSLAFWWARPDVPASHGDQQ
jgi:hypothetical protein